MLTTIATGGRRRFRMRLKICARDIWNYAKIYILLRELTITKIYKLVVNAFTKMLLLSELTHRPPVHSGFYLHFNSFLFIYCCRTFYEIKLPSFFLFSLSFSLSLFPRSVSHRYTKFTARLQCPSVPAVVVLSINTHTLIPSITLHIKNFIVSLSLSLPLWITCELNFIYRFPFCALVLLSLSLSLQSI